MKQLILTLVGCLAIAGCDSGRPQLQQVAIPNKGGSLEIMSEQEYGFAVYRVLRNKETGEKFLVVKSGDGVAVTPMK